MRPLLRLLWVPALTLPLALPVLAGGPETPKDEARKAESADAKAPKAGTKAAAKPAQNSKAAAKKDTQPASESRLRPVPPVLGTLGLLTLESGDSLPKSSFAVVGGVNKFSREPGSITVLHTSLAFAVALTDRWSLFLGFDPNRHIHVDRPTQLSLNPATLGCPQVGTTIYRSIACTTTGAAAYPEDFPFANRNGGGVGDITAGAKFNILSQGRGNPLGLSLRGELIFQTINGLSSILANQTQTGAIQFNFLTAATRNFGGVMELTVNAGFRVLRNPRGAGVDLVQLAKQFRAGAGMLLFPRGRVQVISEYNGVVFFGAHTPNTSFGARDPADAIYGVRLYPWKQVALDIGYRYMINLTQASDRHGFIVKVGSSYTKSPPPPVNHPPVASCAASASSVYAGSGDVVTVTVTASDPDNDPLTYNYSATGGTLEGSGPQVRWSSAGLGPGTYTVNASVDDGRGGSATCSVSIGVEPKPNRPPVITCSADRSSVLAGERVRITANASDPDNDPLTLAWRANAGQIIGSGSSVQFDTTGLSPGTYTVTGRVDDGRGGAADCSVDVKVETPPVQPQASKLNECFFRQGSARVDNVCKRVLDDVALRLSASPRDRVVIVGYADPAEPRHDKVAKQRAESAKKYLQGKGVAESRVETRAAGGQKGAGKQNRRIDVILVPEGATN